MAASEPYEFYAISEMAKYLEHHLRDYARAKDMIENVLSGRNTFSNEEKDSLSHRLKRLNKKLHIL